MLKRKEYVWVVVGHAATTLGTFLLLRVTTEMLGPKQFGTLFLFISIGLLLNQAILGGVISGLIRYYTISSEKLQINHYYEVLKKMMLTLTGFVMLSSCGVLIYLHLSGDNYLISRSVLIVIFALFGNYNNLFSGLLNASRNRLAAAAHTAADPWLKIAIILILTFKLVHSDQTILISYCVATIMISASLWRLFAPLFNQSDGLDTADQTLMRNVIRYAWPFTIFGLFAWARSASDRWALEYFGGSTDVGLYSALFQAGFSPLNGISIVMMTLLSPVVFAAAGDATDSARLSESYRIVMRYTIYCLCGTIACVIIGFILDKSVFNILVAQRYKSVAWMLPWMMLFGGLYSCSQILSLYLYASLKSQTLTAVNILSSIIGIIFNIFGAKYFGLIGVVIGSVLYSIAFIVMIFVVTQVTRWKVLVC